MYLMFLLFNTQSMILEDMDWLGENLGFKKKEDWYSIKWSDFTQNQGTTMIMQCNGSPKQILMQAYPEHQWKGWLFSEVSNQFWNDEANQRECISIKKLRIMLILWDMQWLGEQLQFSAISDWYQIKCRHFFDNKGKSLLIKYGWSPSKVVKQVS